MPTAGEMTKAIPQYVRAYERIAGRRQNRPLLALHWSRCDRTARLNIVAGKIDIEAAAELRAKGHTLQEIADRFQCTKQAVQQLLAHEPSPNRPGIRIRELISRGYRDHEVAIILNVNPQLVHYHRLRLKSDGNRK